MIGVTIHLEDVRAYSCLAGHAIPADLLEQLSQEVTLDEGAVVRLCRDHFAPIAVTVVHDEGKREGGSLTVES